MKREPLNLERLDEYEVVCVDVETTGLNWRRDKAFGVAIAAFPAGRTAIASGYVDLREKPRVAALLADKLPRVKRLVNHHIKFDAHVLRETCGASTPFGRTECTMVRAALINEHEQQYRLDYLARKYVGQGKDTTVYQKLADLFGGKATPDAQMKNLHRAPVEIAREYATPDAEIALLLWAWQEAEIEKQGLHQVWALERELTSVLVEIERDGVPIDEEYARRRLATVMPEREKVVRTLMKKYGGNGITESVFNSPKQKRQLFGVEEREGRHYIGNVLLETTEAGAPSIDADTLRLLADTHQDERAVLIMRAMKLDKAKQFLENHVLGHLEGDRVYPHFNQTKSEFGTGTTTGRFSIEDPALQQIPKRDKQMAEIVRPCFVPEKGKDWACADWEQFEFRWFAHYANDPGINRTYAEDPEADFHKTTAELTGLPRNPRFAGDANAKQINLGLVFGMGKGKLAAEMGLPYTVDRMAIGGEEKEYLKAGPEAEAVFAKYHSAIPGVQSILKEAASIAKSRGFVKTMAGRRLRFPGGKFTHKAGGLVFQGTSADCCKVKMVELYHNGHKQGRFRLMLSVHDEFDFSVEKGDKATVKEIKRRLEAFDGVECPIKCRIPIRSDVNVAANWHEASK